MSQSRQRQQQQRNAVVAVGCAVSLAMFVGGVLITFAVMSGLNGSTPTTSGALQGPAKEGAAGQKPKEGIFRAVGLKLPDPAIGTDHCDDMQSGGAAGDGCITAEIHCDEVVIGHTRGGVKRFDTSFYRQKFCWPDTRDHDGGDERVYRLVMPEGEWHAEITLDTPCANLDLMAAEYDGKGCPDIHSNVPRCEMNLRDRVGEREYIELVSQGHSTWLLVVEGQAPEDEGVFALQVVCKKGLY